MAERQKNKIGPRALEKRINAASNYIDREEEEETRRKIEESRRRQEGLIKAGVEGSPTIEAFLKGTPPLPKRGINIYKIACIAIAATVITLYAIGFFSATYSALKGKSETGNLDNVEKTIIENNEVPKPYRQQ